MIACEEPRGGERDGALGRHPAELGGPLARGRGGRARARRDERQQRAPAASARAPRHGPAPLPSQTLTGTA